MKKKNEVEPNKIYKKFEAEFQEAVNEAFEQAKDLDAEDQEPFIKSAENRAVREFFETEKKYKEAAELIKKNFPYQYDQIKKNRYPTAWMLKDKKINRTLKRFPKLTLIMNYVFNYNRYWRKEEFENMAAINLSMNSVSKFKRKYEYATFLATKDFYNEMAKDVGCGVKLIQKYFRAFCNAGIFIKFGQYKRHEGVLYTDGFFVTTWNDTPRKHALLKNNPDGKTGLRSFVL